MNDFSIRFATENDAEKILFFIKSLAEYENLSNEVVATAELLREWIFDKKKAEALHCSSTIFQPFSAEQEYILKTCLYCPNTEEKGTVKHFFVSLHVLPLSVDAEGLNGAVLTGISQVLIFIYPSEQSLLTTGLYTD